MTQFFDDDEKPVRKGRGEGIDPRGEPMRAVVLAPDLPRPRGEKTERDLNRRTPEQRLEEAIGLALAIDLEIVHSTIIPLAKRVPATLLGSGKVEELAGVIEACNAGLVIVDHSLTPVQQRNLEKAWNAKVLDRTGLILEIFGRRAATSEGSLQVELAHLNYQRGRLVRSWTHLERQRGGAGFLGGPGETQIEADRRIIRDKIKKLETELERVRRTRTLHRKKRKKVPLPIVAFVGYTNAGKSTLFNRITGAQVLAEDMLFATLDPTLRRVRLPGGTPIILSDTVGFISDLPTHLVAAFRATLEEVEEADIILHVHDAADAQGASQAADVRAVLADLGVKGEDEHVIELWNKVDLLDPAAAEALKDRCAATTGRSAVAVSGITGEGIDTLLELIERKVSGAVISRSVTLSPDRLGELAWLYDNTTVDGREDREDGGITLSIMLPAAMVEELDRRFSGAVAP